MQWTSALAIYVLFWVMSAFVVLPFGVRNLHEAGEEPIPGQDRGAPANFNPRRILLRTTMLATLLFGLYYLNYVQGWISAETLGLSEAAG
jgi:predicted secreted protein